MTQETTSAPSVAPDDARIAGMKGYVHVYTGNGKGKTTAAIGLAVRAAGAGLRVYFAQFLKFGEYSEIRALQRFDDLIAYRQYGCGGFIFDKPDRADDDAARQGLDALTDIVASGDYPVVILDEANIAAQLGLIAVDDLLGLIDIKPEPVELAFTGRYADPRLIARADLVTEMKEIKHYFRKGVIARQGIEC